MVRRAGLLPLQAAAPVASHVGSVAVCVTPGSAEKRSPQDVRRETNIKPGSS